DQTERLPQAALARAGEALAALAEAGSGLASADGLADALGAIAEPTARAVRADVVVVRVVDDDRQHLIACAVASASTAVAAELEGTRVPVDELSRDEVDDLGMVPRAVARAAHRVSATAVLQVPIGTGNELEG